MAILKTALIIPLAFVLLGCDPIGKSIFGALQKEHITQITYSHFGGMGGYNEGLNITAQKLDYSYSLRRPNEAAAYSADTSEELWSQLESTCDIAIFAKARSGWSRLPIDGLDTIYTITTNKRTLSILNGDDKNYEMLKDCFEIVRKQVWESNLNAVEIER